MRKLLAAAILVLAMVSVVMAGTATLTWTAPTTYTDGSPIVAGDIASYRVYRGISSRTYTTIATVSGAVTTTTLTSIPTGTTYFAITAVDKLGNESDFSNEISKFVPRSRMNAPILGGVVVALGVVPASPLTHGTVTTGVQKYIYLSLENQSPINQTVSSLTVTGAGFSVNPSLPITLPANSSKRVRVNFQPPTVGLYTGAVLVGLGEETMAIPLSGVGR